MMFKKAKTDATDAMRQESTTHAPGLVKFVPAAPPAGPLHDILLVAIEKGINFQELLAAQREMIVQQEERALTEAIAAFQANVPVIVHNKKVMNKPPRQDTVRYTYADLDRIMSTIRPALGAHGISVTWDSALVGDCYTATASVRRGGAVRTGTFSSKVDPDAYMTDQQKGASANKFAMRNAVIMALGLTSCGMEDDDGQAAGAAPRISNEQGNEIHALLEQTDSDLFKFLKIFGAETLSGIAASDYGRAMGMLKKKLNKMEEGK